MSATLPSRYSSLLPLPPWSRYIFKSVCSVFTVEILESTEQYKETNKHWAHNYHPDAPVHILANFPQASFV